MNIAQFYNPETFRYLPAPEWMKVYVPTLREHWLTVCRHEYTGPRVAPIESTLQQRASGTKAARGIIYSQVLRIMQRHPEGMRSREISIASKINRNTMNTIISEMCARNMLVRKGDRHSYIYYPAAAI